ncbi:hypothetical protein B0T11DRAFT_332784 [Plectosphaerella cucumerina]|uniref:Uncharacterized protein n=1 Tax=Plectosphaerella cucumerina TaxID=40658 RepID=A0A8K0TC17_9PEZI|nr:hypothetical protein B0T11DRAFT_332784 [Plectosphaerella cucumerina]
MKTFTIALIGAAAFFSRALAVPFDAEDPLQGRDIFTPEWEVEVKPGGDTVVLNGTIQEVHAQLLDLNPNWDTDFKDDDLDKREADFGDWADDTAGLDKRANFNGASYNCWGRWGAVSREHIQSGINYLRRVRGKPRAGAGPSKCGRVSCSYNSAIYWCNDSNKPKTLNSFGSIADGAQYIMGKCKSVAILLVKPKTGGQAFTRRTGTSSFSTTLMVAGVKT